MTITEGSGPFPSAALFWLAAAALVAGSFLWTYRVATPRDALIGYVPEDASSYLHYQARGAAEARADAYALFGLPSGLAPDEVATLRHADADDAGSSLKLVRWNDASAIGGAERRILEDERSQEIDATTFILRAENASGRDAILAARASGKTLAATTIGNGLRQMRSVAPIQGYLKDLALPDMDAAAPGAVAPRAATVFGVVFDERGLAGGSMTLLMPATGIPQEKPLLGFSILDHASRAPDRVDFLSAPDAAFMQSRLRGGPVAPPMLFDALVDAARRYGSPADAAIASAEEGLRALLAPPFALSTASDASLSEGTALHLPEASPEALRAGMDALLASLFPEKQGLLLPDETTANEFYRRNSTSAFVPLDGSSDRSQQVDAGHPSGLHLIIAPDGLGGSVLTDSPGLLEGLVRVGVGTGGASPRCRTAAALAEESMALRGIDHSLLENALPTELLERNKLISADFYGIDDALMVVCTKRP